MRKWRFNIGDFVYGPFNASGKVTTRIENDELNQYRIEGSGVTFMEDELGLKPASRIKNALYTFRGK